MVSALTYLPTIGWGRRRQGLSWAVAFSILIHVAIGWFLVSRFLIQPAMRSEDSIVIEFQPPVARPIPPPPPEVDTDKVEPPEQKVRKAPIRTPLRPAAASDVEALPIEAGPVEPDLPIAPDASPAQPAVAPKPTVRVSPVFPERAAEANKSGEVEVYLTVTASGTVSDVEIVREEPRGYGFGRAAAAAVRRWEFAGAAPGVYRVTVKFRLDD